ncbi:MAG: riboflavin biosynthesis protein RibD, partial [Chloroflexi bacterium]|nr:riboflavin biosynthesis protein RibD [Chloroflexota bacterium]
GVITAFLRAGLADVLVVTIAPVLAGGYHAVQGPCADEWAALPRLSAMSVERAGEDVIVWGDITKGASA